MTKSQLCVSQIHSNISTIFKIGFLFNGLTSFSSKSSSLFISAFFFVFVRFFVPSLHVLSSFFRVSTSLEAVPAV